MITSDAFSALAVEFRRAEATTTATTTWPWTTKTGSRTTSFAKRKMGRWNCERNLYMSQPSTQGRSSVSDRKLRFKVEAHDEDQKVGEGTHRRAIIQIGHHG